MICHLLELHMHVDCHKTLLALPNVLEKLCLHMLVANIGDKLFPWHWVLFVWETERPVFQSSLQHPFLVLASINKPIFCIN